MIGQNIKRIRDDVEGMKGSDLSDRLNELGLKLSTSGVSEVETPTRKLGADELLIIAIALNTSIIDLLTPRSHPSSQEGGKGGRLQLQLTDCHLSARRRGRPPQTKLARMATLRQRLKGGRCGIAPKRERTFRKVFALRSAVTGATDGPSDFNQVEDAKVMAEYLPDQVERVATYVNLLADRLEKPGYAER